ncbi:MAG: hypothetical protein ACK5PU_00975 [bacterium]
MALFYAAAGSADHGHPAVNFSLNMGGEGLGRSPHHHGTLVAP